MRNILTTLESEHDRLHQLYRQLNATTDDQEDERQSLVQRIEALLIPHSKWEELVFYRVFAERANHDQQMLQAAAMQEHRAIEQSVLPDLHATDYGSRQFAGSAFVLGEMTVHHSQEEEARIFPAMRQLFAERELADLDEQYAEWKRSPMATAVELHAKVKTMASSVFRLPNAPG